MQHLQSKYCILKNNAKTSIKKFANNELRHFREIEMLNDLKKVE